MNKSDYIRLTSQVLAWGFCALLLSLCGCTNVTVDHYSTAALERNDSDAVVVLGRRYASNYDTEIDLISCVGESLAEGAADITVIPESEFVDRLYPWFEPRTAPLHVTGLHKLIDQAPIAKIMDEYKIRHIIWIDGNTETTHSSGSIGCSIGVGGAGCFGFGSWDRESNYEATIWDYRDRSLIAKVSTEAAGTSYMPAVIVPVPLIARVQNNACKGMADQLDTFFLSASAE
ncbi:hypothetical protein NBRC116494_08290 [Aurantivibrio plasticivorans]